MKFGLFRGLNSFKLCSTEGPGGKQWALGTEVLPCWWEHFWSPRRAVRRWSFHRKEKLWESVEEKGLGMKGLLSLPISFCSIWKAGVLMNWLKIHPQGKSNEVPTKLGDISLQYKELPVLLIFIPKRCPAFLLAWISLTCTTVRWGTCSRASP